MARWNAENTRHPVNTMLSETQIMAIFTRILDRMVRIRWLHHYTFTDQEGFDLAWTHLGATEARLLGIIIKLYRLDEEDEGPMRFDRLAHDKGPVGDMTSPALIDEDMKQWWREGVAELGVRGDDDALLSMVHLIRNWKPDSETSVWPDP